MSNTESHSNCASNGGKWIRQDKRLAIYLRDGLQCVYCGRTLEQGSCDLTLDHVTPQELGGSNEASNLVTACKSCNSKKQAKTVREFLAWLREQGQDTDGLAARIRRHTRRNLRRYRRMAKAVLKARQ